MCLSVNSGNKDSQYYSIIKKLQREFHLSALLVVSERVRLVFVQLQRVYLLLEGTTDGRLIRDANSR